MSAEGDQRSGVPVGSRYSLLPKGAHVNTGQWLNQLAALLDMLIENVEADHDNIDLWEYMYEISSVCVKLSILGDLLANPPGDIELPHANLLYLLMGLENLVKKAPWADEGAAAGNCRVTPELSAYVEELDPVILRGYRFFLLRPSELPFEEWLNEACRECGLATGDTSEIWRRVLVEPSQQDRHPEESAPEFDERDDPSESKPAPTAPTVSGRSGQPTEIDHEALATELRKQRRPKQAALVEYMADKLKAQAEAIAKDVHGDPETSDRAIWNNARRTSDWLAAKGSRLSFRFASGWVYREISPK